MALVPCVECEREISSKALTCPGCGVTVKEVIQPTKAKNKGKAWEAIGAISVVGGFIAMVIGGSPTGSLFLFFGFIIFIIGRFL